jgi:putative PIN family toxin of toxin-antitoxin system
LGLVRVVLDTNILISACLKPDGLEARAAAMAVAGTIEACVTEAVLAEYRDVLLRPKFLAWRSTAEALLEALSQRAVRVTSGAPVHAATDEDDNRFLECAEAGEAAYLITGNLRHFPAAWGGTNIVNARMFFNVIGMTERTDCHPGL